MINTHDLAGNVLRILDDANGNMTTRKVGATTYTRGWDAENRLVSVSGEVSTRV